MPIITGITFSNIMMAVHKPITEKEVFLIGSQRRPGADRRRAVLALPVHRLLAERQRRPRWWASTPRTRATSASWRWRRTTRPARTSSPASSALYKGEVIDEIYTPLNQPDFSAEIAQVAATQPDAVFVFYPGGLGINFVRQYQQAGLLGKIPLLSASHHRRHRPAGA